MAYNYVYEWKPYSNTMTFSTEEHYEVLEDGQWSPLYEYEDYVGIAHQIMAEELGYA